MLRILKIAALLLLSLSVVAQEKLTPEELIAKHLNSIGTAQARSAVSVRTVNGKYVMETIVGATGGAAGDIGVISSGRKMKLIIRSTDERYPGEKVWFDGRKPGVDLPGVAGRTFLGDFLYRNDTILRDGLFTGALSTSWALENVKERGAKLTYDGLKMIDGVSLHQLTYVPKKAASELMIHLYFEPETFRHVMTIYKLDIAGYMNVSPQRGDRTGVTQNTSKTIYTITEKFSDFQAADGLTLPRKWQLEYTVEPVRSVTMRWTANWTRIANNPKIDLSTVFPEN